MLNECKQSIDRVHNWEVRENMEGRYLYCSTCQNITYKRDLERALKKFEKEYLPKMRGL